MSDKKFVPYKTSEELKPCPYCGSNAEEKQVKGSFGGYDLREVYCNGCSAQAMLKDWEKREWKKPD